MGNVVSHVSNDDMSPLLNAWEAVLRTIVSAAVDVFNDGVDLIISLAKAFPNLAKMGDLTARFVTGLSGRLVNLPLEMAAEDLIGYLRVAKLHNRLIRADDMIRFIIVGPNYVMRQMTFTDESGILGLLAGWLARFLYRAAKRFKLLRAILMAKSEEAFVAVILKALKMKVVLFFWAGLVVASIVIITFFVASWSIGFAAVGMFLADGRKLLLPQDSKRAWRKRGSVARVNRRTGADFP